MNRVGYFLRRPALLLSLLFILLVVMSALFAPWLTPFDPDEQFVEGLSLEGAPLSPNSTYWLGTDLLGRDLFSRLIYGARTSLLIGVVANGTAVLIGVLVGLSAGYLQGRIGGLLMRFTDLMMAFPALLLAIALAAMAGGVLTSLVVWLLAWRNGIETFRLIIIGIGVRAMLVAFNTWLLLRASLETALSAGLWNAGSLNGLTWGKTWPSAPLILLMLVGSALLVRRMRLLEMGDDTACALGVQVERSRLLLMLVAVVLTAASTALAGPISFIALVVPHIARRLSGTARWGLTQSALCGALLLALADYGAQRLFMPWQLPVGVLTVSLGGIYLIALLIQESRKK